MKRSDISDRLICEAIALSKKIREEGSDGAQIVWPHDLIMPWLDVPFAVVDAALNRAYERDLIECGVSLRSAWLTEKGRALITRMPR